MSQAQVCRIVKDKNYTTMANYHLRDKNLSLKAKGLLSVVLSLPPSWDYSVAGLVAIVMEKETVVRSCLKELKEAGYLVVEKERPTKENGGHFNYIYIFYEKSQLLNHKIGNSICENLDVESLDVEVLDVEVLDVENQRQINTNKLNKEELNKEELKVDSKRRKVFKKPSIEEVQAYCEERGNSVDAEEFVDFYESKGWVVGKSPMKDWKAAVRTWEKNSYGSKTNKAIQKNDTAQESAECAYKLWEEIMGQPCKRDKWNDQAGWNMMRAKDKGEEWLRGMIILARECKKDPKTDFRASHIANLADLQKNQEYVLDWYRNRTIRKDTKSEQALDFLWKSH